MKKQLVNRGFSFPERVYGHFLSGGMTLEYVLLVLDHLSARTNEIYFHPELSDGGACSGTDQQPGMREAEVLTSSVLRDRLQNSAIALTNYFGLAANA